MLLAMDIGNTNIVLGVFENTERGMLLRQTWRTSTHPFCTSDELRAKISVLASLDGLDTRNFKSAIVSSVVPPLSEVARGALKGLQIHFIDHKSPFSFKIAANPPSQVGADRLVNAEAVAREFGSPAIIVDSGTATTVCALSAEGTYLGGAIMPGIDLSIQALAKNAAKLFTVELNEPPAAIGRNTQEALQSGILLGYASMVDGMVRRFKTELSADHSKAGTAIDKIKVIATGGVSQKLKGLAQELTHFEPDLTLKGLWYIHESLRSR